MTAPTGNGWSHESVRRRDGGSGASGNALEFRSLGAGRQLPPGGLAVVVFVDETACPWLRPLRRGFRHCFVVMRAGPLWLACEPLKDRIELDILDLPHGFDLGCFYSRQGHRVLWGQRPALRSRAGFAPAPLTCVTVVKRVLGIHAPWVWSPWQLYRHLCAPLRGFRPWSEEPPTDPAAALATGAASRRLTFR